MENTAYAFFEYYSSSPFLLFIALAVTVCFCLFATPLFFRSKLKPLESNKPCSCSSRKESIEITPIQNVFGSTVAELGQKGSTSGGEEMVERVPVAVPEERQSGASMMEQLVPEITTHALSYLDYPSLCRLSMTNSLMRKAANDDNAWKALYHKDFTLEQDTVTPVNGWKAYYAATRALMNVNNEFFQIIRDKSLAEMGRFWLNADYVKCFHASGEFFTGYGAVMQSWQLAFNWDQVFNFDVQDVRVRVLTDVAWVTMKAYLDMEAGSFYMTNIFESHNGRWYMVHHHSSVMLPNGGGEQQMVLG